MMWLVMLKGVAFMSASDFRLLTYVDGKRAVPRPPMDWQLRTWIPLPVMSIRMILKSTVCMNTCSRRVSKVTALTSTGPTTTGSGVTQVNTDWQSTKPREYCTGSNSCTSAAATSTSPSNPRGVTESLTMYPSTGVSRLPGVTHTVCSGLESVTAVLWGTDDTPKPNCLAINSIGTSVC